MIAERIMDASAVVAFTGAGISAESGISTFRDPDGIWMQMSPQELASVDGFMSNPTLVWGWYRERLRITHSVTPNAGHRALVGLQRCIETRSIPGLFTLITQNVDGLHQRAGSENVLELHGNLNHNHCQECSLPYPEDSASDAPPRCRSCGGPVRPSVVWFGENLPADVMAEAEERAINCDVFLSIGTTAEVYPAAGLPLLALRGGAFIVEINPRETVLTPHVHATVRMAAGKALPAIVSLLDGGQADA